VPRQSPPYRGLAEVISDQHVFDLADVEGTMVGFRFPDYSEGIEVSGYHLHFITADRTRGGHVLECHPTRAVARIDASTDLHVELPPGVDLADRGVAAATHAAVEAVERGG
jgi:acetolactate decarboxylase